MPTSFIERARIWFKREFLINLSLSVILLLASLSVAFYANYYTTINASNSVTDIILDNVPTVNVDFFYSEGAAVFLIFIIIILINKPHRIPFTMKGISVFILIRSFFIILTHIAPPDHMAYLDNSDLIHMISSGDDLFFSAHTGLPFLFALIFWNERYLRYIFIASTIAGAIVVLLGHIHYSIDVFSALFITYGIYVISCRIFKKDYELFLSREEAA